VPARKNFAFERNQRAKAKAAKREAKREAKAARARQGHQPPASGASAQLPEDDAAPERREGEPQP
jgi:hypothetical protein